MNQAFLLVAIILLSAPLVWRSSKFWQGKLMMLVTFQVFAWMAPLSLALMLSVAAVQWMVWRFIPVRYKKPGFIITILLPLLPLVTYKLAHKTSDWILP